MRKIGISGFLVVASMVVLLAGCDDDEAAADNGEEEATASEVESEQSAECSGEFLESDGVAVCAFSAELAEEEGFECPEDYPEVVALKDAVACADVDSDDERLVALLGENGYEKLDDQPKYHGVRVCDADEDLTDDAYDLTAVEIGDDDTLVIDVEYGGGCKTHQWTLCWDGKFMESLPAQAALTLYHDSDSDKCQVLKRDSLVFDLTPVLEDFDNAYGTEPGSTLTLNLVNDDKSVDYDWD